MSELSAITLQRYIARLSANGNTKIENGGLSSSTVNGIITVLQSSLKQAVNLGVTETQFADKIQRPKTNEKPVECFTLTEQKKVEQYILNGKKPKLFGIVLCLYTGLRIGELLALEWSDIDFEKALLSVTKTCHDGKTDG